MLAQEARLAPATVPLPTIAISAQHLTRVFGTSPKPNVWRLRNLTIVSLVLGFCDLLFCSGSLAIGHFGLHLGARSLQTLTVAPWSIAGRRSFTWCASANACGVRAPATC